MLGHLPMLLAREPKSVLTIGLASGCTLGAIEQYPDAERMDCVEIEPAMADVVGFFRDINRNCLKDRRARLIVNDARNFVLVSRDRYDVLTSEPSNPWIAGIANLFSLEHFRLCRERMTPDGVFCQWVPIYNLAPQDFRCIAATFQQVFPNSSVWLFPELPSDAYLIGTRGPLSLDAVQLARRAARSEVARDLQQAGLRDAWDVLGGYVCGPDVMAALAEGQTPNTDDFPTLEFSAPLRLYTTSPQDTLAQILGLGLQANPPLSSAGQETPEGYRSALTGLFIPRPWKVSTEEVCVARDLQAYMQGPGSRPVKVGVRLRCASAAGEFAVLVARPGDFAAFGTEQAEPLSPALRTIRAAGHEASFWTRPFGADGPAWVIRWLCPERARAYVVHSPAGPAPQPERAPAEWRCTH
jgi:spermidine synthase